jgi:hypothetical protein
MSCGTSVTLLVLNEMETLTNEMYKLVRAVPEKKAAISTLGEGFGTADGADATRGPEPNS